MSFSNKILIARTVSLLVTLSKASATALAGIVKLWTGVQMNEANYVGTIHEPMVAALEASKLYSSDGSLRKAASNNKTAILAICNGIAPVAGERLETFCQRVRDMDKGDKPDGLAARGVCKKRKVGATKRKSGAAKNVADKGKKASGKARHQAALLLASNNLADAQALQYMSANGERLAIVRACYAKLIEADKV
jgi:hypothetical protein